jgi:Ca2+/Na+ antiporter
LFLFCLSPCCVLCTQCCPFMIVADWVHKTQHGDKKNKNKTQKKNRQSWMDNIEYIGHNTETNKLNTKHRKLNRQWLPILFSAFCFYFVCLCVVSCIFNVANVSGCPFMIVADLVFCVLFLFCLSPCCVFTKKIKIKHRKQNLQQSWMDNIEYTRHNTETNKIKTKHRKPLPILFSAFCFYFVCLCVVSCILNVANFSGCPFMIVADLVFCVLFLFCLSPCCVLCTQCCPFMIADFVFCVLFLFSYKQNKNKTQKTKSAIMNGQHWVHRTQHRDKENKNKIQKTKSATIMNGQHW